MANKEIIYQGLNYLTNGQTSAENEEIYLQILADVKNAFSFLKVNLKAVTYKVFYCFARFIFEAEDSNEYLKLEELNSLDISAAMGFKYRDVALFLNQADGPVCVDVPINQKNLCCLKDLLQDYEEKSGGLIYPVGGKAIGEKPLFADLTKQPHLFVSGSTGTGKSVFLNSAIISLALKYSPEELNFVMVDPKQVELNCFKKLPHLRGDIITDMPSFVAKMQEIFALVNERYELFEKSDCVEIKQFNSKAKEENKQILPYVVVVIDEICDLLYGDNNELIALLRGILVKSRAVGIHFIFTTQNVRTVKDYSILLENVNARIAFKLCCWEDSEAVIGNGSATNLLGRGDALFGYTYSSTFERLQTPYIDMRELLSLIDFISDAYNK